MRAAVMSSDVNIARVRIVHIFQRSFPRGRHMNGRKNDYCRPRVRCATRGNMVRDWNTGARMASQHRHKHDSQRRRRRRTASIDPKVQYAVLARRIGCETRLSWRNRYGKCSSLATQLLAATTQMVSLRVRFVSTRITCR